MAIYMKWGNNDIKGNVTLKGHEEWIELHSFSWGNSRAISTTPGGGEDREASQPSVSEAVVTKDFDKSSVSLWKASLATAEAKPCQIDFVRTGGPTGEGYTVGTILLSNTMVASYSLSSGGDMPSESFSLNATKWEWHFNPSQVSGEQAPAPIKGSYDLATSLVE